MKAIKSIDIDFKKWLETQSKPDKNSYISVQWAWVKSFDLADVQWNDDHHVAIHGILGASPKGGHDHFFSWTRKLEFKGDGVDNWWQADDASFASATLTADDTKHMLTRVIVMPE